MADDWSSPLRAIAPQHHPVYPFLFMSWSQNRSALSGDMPPVIADHG